MVIYGGVVCHWWSWVGSVRVRLFAHGGCRYCCGGDGNIQVQLPIWLRLRELRCCLGRSHGDGLACSGGYRLFAATHFCLDYNQTRDKNIISRCE